MISAYYHAATTLNLLRAMNYTQYSRYLLPIDIKHYPGSTEPANYISLLEQLYHSQHYVINKPPNTSSFYISHEALLLPYEEAMTRKDSTDNKWYNCSAHMVWVGERTTNIEQAHIEYLRGIENPIGIKCSVRMTAENLVQLVNKLNPQNEVGKIILIIRMGKDNIQTHLPKLIQAVQQNNLSVIWLTDPMHGNTQSTDSGLKTRYFSDITTETHQFIQTLRNYDLKPGGIHLEMTGQEVTECIGGLQQINHNDLRHGYQTLCDPRLNRTQSLELAFLLGQHWTV